MSTPSATPMAEKNPVPLLFMFCQKSDSQNPIFLKISLDFFFHIYYFRCIDNSDSSEQISKILNRLRNICRACLLELPRFGKAIIDADGIKACFICPLNIKSPVTDHDHRGFVSLRQFPPSENLPDDVRLRTEFLILVAPTISEKYCPIPKCSRISRTKRSGFEEATASSRPSC